MIRSPLRLLGLAPSARLLLLALGGCLVPPSGQDIEFSRGPLLDRNAVQYSPRIAVTIRAGTLETSLDDILDGFCSSQIFSLDGVVDRDSDLLLFRWVANNGLEDAAVLDEGDDRRDPDDPDEPFDFQHTLLFPGPYEREMRRAAFREGGGTTRGFLTLFVTDATSWRNAADNPPADNDFSRIPERSEGSVVAFDWALTFERGPCS